MLAGKCSWVMSSASPAVSEIHSHDTRKVALTPVEINAANITADLH